MATRWQTLTVVSTRRTELLDITEAVGRACREGDAGDGLVVVYCPHTTAGILIQEAEPGLLHDLEGWLSRAVPSDASYRHDRIDDNAAKPPTGGRRRGERHGAFYEAAGRVKSLLCLSLCFVSVVWCRGVSGPARFCHPSIRAHQGRGIPARRRTRGFEGWGRHLRGGTRTAAKAPCALTHPSNLRETGALPVTSSWSRGDRGRRSGLCGAARVEHAPISEQRIEDASQAAG